MNSREWIANIRDNGGELGQFDKYRLGQTISAGGFSKIYLASRDGYQYAMKLPNIIGLDNGDSINLDKDTFASFKSEAERWSLISNVVPDDVVCLLDFGYDPFPWMLMEYAEDTFAREIESGDVDMDDFKSILDSLQRIHNVRMRHLDIKPENILLVDGRWKFSDFGLSSLDSSRTGSDSLRGTPEYMAPEQIDPEKRSSCDNRTDIWQMGIILYRIVTGHGPYPGKDYSDIMIAIQSGGPDISEIGEPYRSILKKALAIDMDSRFRSAREMREALDAAGCSFRPIVSSDIVHSETLERAISLYGGYQRYDEREAFRLFSEEGSVLAKAYMARMLNRGDGVESDIVAAMELASSVLSELSSMAKFDPVASWLLGEFYLSGIGVDKDPDFAFVNIKRAADAGFPPALYAVGFLTEDGQGTQSDPRKALVYYTKAADAEYALAQRILASEYISGGELVDVDLERGMKLISRAADKGEPVSCAYVGLRYCLGDIVQRDLDRGFGLLIEAYEMGVEFTDTYSVLSGPVIRKGDFPSGHCVAVLLDGVTEIDDEAFANSDLEAILLPETLRRIGAGAFQSSKIRSIRIPDGVTILGPKAFQFCRNLNDIHIGNGVKIIETKTFDQALVGDISLLSCVREIKSGAFNWSGVRSVEMPGIEMIGADAFSGCSNLGSVTMGEHPVVISDRAFNHCTGLSQLSFDSVVDIGPCAFDGCSSLTSVDLPNIEVLRYGAFEHCNNLSSVRLGPRIREIGSDTMRGTRVDSLIVPSDFEIIHDESYYGVRIEREDAIASIWKDADPSTEDTGMEEMLTDAGFSDGFIQGMLLYTGISERRDLYEAFQTFFSQEDIASRIMMAWMRYTGSGTYRDRDYPKVLTISDADISGLGDDAASDWLRYLMDTMRSKHSESLEHLRRSAKEGFPPAENDFGRLTFYGSGIPEDREEGARWIAKAASHGLVRAMDFLAYCYREGEGVPQSHDKAFELYSRAAEQGSSDAEYQLSVMCEKGLGTPRSSEEASIHKQRAADLGSVDALYSLYPTGSCYLEMLRSPDERTVPRLIEASGSLFHGANPSFALGIAYEFGLGVAPSEEASRVCYAESSEARDQVSPELRSFRDELLAASASQPKMEEKPEKKKHRWFGR